jgi:fucose 4-O-acetylase-like acetyltransferase
LETKGKELSIETLRGFAIILMVAGHVLGETPGTGMGLPVDHSGWRYFYYTFEYLRMPLFAAISGYVYSKRPAGDSKILTFYKGKARRILLPLIFVGTVHFLLQYFVPGTNSSPRLSDIWKIFFTAYEHFYFLQSTFLIFLFIGIIDHLKLMLSLRNWLIIFLLAAMTRNLIPHFYPNIFSINGFFSLLPFFILGCGINRFPNLFTLKAFIKPVGILFILAIFLQQYIWFSGSTMSHLEIETLSIFVGFSGIIILSYIRKDIPIMSRIGYYSFGIYLFHVFGTAGSRILLSKFNIGNNVIVFSIGLLFGILIPIVIELNLEKSKITRRLFLGLR